MCATEIDRFSVLVLSVSLPGAHRSSAVEIGLAGTGLTARTIFGSLRPA